MRDTRLYEAVKYIFDPTEIKELGEALAREAQTVFDLKDRKSSVDAELTAQIKAANSRVAELTTKINSGFELREVECMVLMETPRPGMKRIIRLDDNSIVREEAMTASEMQSSFGFNEGEDSRPEK